MDRQPLMAPSRRQLFRLLMHVSKKTLHHANPQLADVVALGGLLKNFDWNEEAPVNDECVLNVSLA